MATDTQPTSTGRRKNAIARVRLTPGEGRITVNEKQPLAYFGRSVLVQTMTDPLKAVDSMRRFDVAIKVLGGGMSGQAGAAAHGIARALIVEDISLRPVLKAGGFLTRDPRAKERKKPGLKRARKAPQYTKR